MGNIVAEIVEAEHREDNVPVLAGGAFGWYVAGLEWVKISVDANGVLDTS